MRALVVFAAALRLVAQVHEVQSAPASAQAASLGDIEAGRQLFENSCGGCHGPGGEGGRGPELLTRVASGVNADALFRVIRTGVPGTEMPASALPDNELRNLTAFLRSLARPASEALPAGDEIAGRQVFRGAKAGCVRCHAILGEGGHLGPDLSSIGARPLAFLRQAILEPSKRAAQDYQFVAVTMQDGSEFRGTVRHRNNYSVQVIDSTGELHLMSTRDVKSIEVLPGAGMQGDFKTRLSEAELRNLLRYLAGQSLRAEKR